MPWYDFFNANNYHRSLENRKKENNKSPLSLDNYFLNANGSKCSYLEKIKKKKKENAQRVSPLQLYQATLDEISKLWLP